VARTILLPGWSAAKPPSPLSALWGKGTTCHRVVPQTRLRNRSAPPSEIPDLNPRTGSEPMNVIDPRETRRAGVEELLCTSAGVAGSTVAFQAWREVPLAPGDGLFIVVS